MFMKVAVLLPAKEINNDLNRAIASIISQSFFLKNDYEIFLVDNSQSGDIFKKLERNAKTTILKCSQKGIVPALNTGIFEILNRKDIKYIARIDSDDEWLPQKLERQFEILLKDPEIKICGTQMRLIKKNENTVLPFENSFYPTESEGIKRWLYNGANPFCHPSVIYNKEIFKTIGVYDSNYKYAEDIDLWLRAAKYFKFANTSELLINYTFENKGETYNKIQQGNATLAFVRTMENKKYNDCFV